MSDERAKVSSQLVAGWQNYGGKGAKRVAESVSLGLFGAARAVQCGFGAGI